MALTPEQIDAAYRVVWTTVPHRNRLSAFARAIEAEVRKDDEALIRQLVDALASCSAVPHWPSFQPAITAARARLAPPPPTA